MNKKDRKSYTMDDYGLLVGLISIPQQVKDPKEFFKQGFEENLSKNYKDRRGSLEGMSDQLYKYRGYKTFGEHDLVVLTLIDDLAYPIRSFHPAHGNHRNIDTNEIGKYFNYEYQVMTCLNTMTQERNLRLENFFETEIDKYPYACITRIKISNGFLLGNGIDFVEEIKNTLYSWKGQLPFSGEKFEMLILDNLGCEELIVLNFSDQWSTIAQFTYKLRCMCVKQLNNPDYVSIF